MSERDPPWTRLEPRTRSPVCLCELGPGIGVEGYLREIDTVCLSESFGEHVLCWPVVSLPDHRPQHGTARHNTAQHNTTQLLNFCTSLD